MALVITLALWFGVTGLSTPTTKRFTVPLNPSISNNSEITNTLISDVDIVVSGDKRKLDQINKSDLSATLDLMDVAPGDRVVSLSPDNVSVALPQGIKLVEIQPTRIAVKLEAVEEKDIDVKVQTEGIPPTGYEIYDTTVVPEKIRVRGPASLVKTLDFVETDKIDVSDKKTDFTARQIPVSSGNAKTAVLNTVVDVYFRIGEKRIERSFTIALAGSPGKTATFTVYGPRSLLTKAHSDAFKAEIIDAGEPRIILPPELQDRVDVEKVTVK